MADGPFSGLISASTPGPACFGFATFMSSRSIAATLV
jgi:hypothetical protein